jgi:hypothetical protein
VTSAKRAGEYIVNEVICEGDTPEFIGFALTRIAARQEA